MSVARVIALHRQRANAIDLMLGLAPKASATSPYRARAVWLLSDLAARVEAIDAELAAIACEERERMAMRTDIREVERLAGRRVTVVEEAA